MKRLVLCLLAICFVTAPAIYAQSSPERGRLPMADLPSLETGTAATVFGGTFVFNITVTIKSALPTTDVITCGASVVLNDGATSTNPIGREILESATIIATRSGSTATCKVVIPYSWSLTTSALDTVNLSFLVTATPATSTTAAGTITRQNSQGLGSIKVPLAGATTTETVPVTI